MWNWIKRTTSNAITFLNGKKRRIAMYGGAATAVGTLTGFVPLIVLGIVTNVVFGGADQVNKLLEKKK